jgi:Rieske Fe-S protein
MADVEGYESSSGAEASPDLRQGDAAAQGVQVRTRLTSYVPGDDPQARLDVRVDSAGREGLAGTTPANIYKPLGDDETITKPPDWRPMDAQPQWRKDFPIDWPQDHYVARRDFVKFMVLTSLAMFVGQVWIAVQNWFRRRAGKPQIVKIASLKDLPVGGTLVFDYPGPNDKCVLVRVEEDLLLAYSQKCTHLQCAVIPRPEKGIIHCPCHEGYFDLRSGEVLSGPPPRPLPKILLDVRGDDVYATGVEYRTV